MTRPSSLADLASIYDSQPISGMRNRIINGDMRIDQRNAGASVTQTTSDLYTLDRWFIFGNSASRFSAQRNAGGVTPPTGFTNYFGTTSLSAYSVGAPETFGIFQSVEGFNVADLGWGAAGALPITVSFWVRSSLTGTFGGAIQNGSFNRAYPFTYTINALNTWEYKTITIPGDTTGSWSTNNTIGLRIQFSLGSGSSVSTTANAWAAGNFNSVTGATSVVGTNGATFYVTGVQLEAGPFATPFERRSFGQELLLCQRYFYRNNALTYFAGGSGNSNVARGAAKFGVTMRATPTVVVNGASNLSGTNGLAYVSNTNGTTPINIIDTITVDGFDTIGNTGGLPSTSFLYAVSFTANAEL